MKKTALVCILACIFLFAHNAESSEDFSGTITLPHYEAATSWNYDAVIKGTDGAGHYWIGFLLTETALKEALNDQSSISSYNISYSNGNLGFYSNPGVYAYNCNSDFTVCQTPGNFGQWGPVQLIASSYDFGIDVPVSIYSTQNPTYQLTIIIDPIEGGSVTDGNSIQCNVSTSQTCTYSLSVVSQSTLTATANCNVNGIDYAFGYWKETENPHPLSLNTNADKTITAKFFKTFTNRVGCFQQTSGYYGECLNYVEYETGLPDDVCTGYAVNCFAQASVKGYATGSTPRVGAIIVFARTAIMDSGHVGIVAAIDEGAGTMYIHDANWTDHNGNVQDHTVNINNSSILGYIYFTP